jgi:hypothetical protein
MLAAALASLNKRIVRFLAGILDADHGMAEHALTAAEEQQLGQTMVELGEAVQRHGRRQGLEAPATIRPDLPDRRSLPPKADG